MIAVDRRRLRRNFGERAEHYDGHARIQQEVVSRLVRGMGTSCPEEGLFLDVGCGTGALALELCRVRPRLQPVLTDLAHGMTRYGRDRVYRALAVDGAADALPFASASFVLVCSSSVYQWVGDLSGAFAESARVLRPGGLFAFALFGNDTLRELKTAYRQAAGMVCVQGSHLHELPRCREVKQALQTVGYVEIEVRRETLVEYHDSVPDLLRSLKQIGAGNVSTLSPRGLASRSLMQKMTEIYRCNHELHGRIPASYEVIYGTGRIASF